MQSTNEVIVVLFYSGKIHIHSGFFQTPLNPKRLMTACDSVIEEVFLSGPLRWHRRAEMRHHCGQVGVGGDESTGHHRDGAARASFLLGSACLVPDVVARSVTVSVSWRDRAKFRRNRFFRGESPPVGRHVGAVS